MRAGIVAATTVLALLAGCGDDGGGGTPEGGATPPVALTGTVNDHGTKDVTSGGEAEVELDDFYFGPTFLRATPSAALTLKLKNEGGVAHTMTADGFGVDVTVQPGAEGEATITLPASGAVRFYCRFHQGQGMQGAFYFNAGDSVAPGGSVPAPTGSGGGDGAYNQ